MYSCNSKGEKTDSEGSKCTKCNKERAKVWYSRLTKKGLESGLCGEISIRDIIQHIPQKKIDKSGLHKTNQKSTDREREQDIAKTRRKTKVYCKCGSGAL